MGVPKVGLVRFKCKGLVSEALGAGQRTGSRVIVDTLIPLVIPFLNAIAFKVVVKFILTCPLIASGEEIVGVLPSVEYLITASGSAAIATVIGAS